MTIINSTFDLNDGGGILIDNYSGNASSYVTISGSRVSNNDENGIYINSSASGSVIINVSGNSLYNNDRANSGYFNLEYAGTDTANAEWNWWGSAADPSADISGSVDYAPWLTVDPGL